MITTIDGAQIVIVTIFRRVLTNTAARHALIDCARVVIIASDGCENTVTVGRITRVTCAFVQIIAHNWFVRTLACCGITLIGGACISVVARFRCMRNDTRRGIARVVGALISIVNCRQRHVQTTTCRRVTRINRACIVVVAIERLCDALIITVACIGVALVTIVTLTVLLAAVVDCCFLAFVGIEIARVHEAWIGVVGVLTHRVARARVANVLMVTRSIHAVIRRCNIVIIAIHLCIHALSIEATVAGARIVVVTIDGSAMTLSRRAIALIGGARIMVVAINEHVKNNGSSIRAGHTTIDGAQIMIIN